MKKVSVIIPTYKRPVAYVSRAVASVIHQTYQNIEIIVIDDSPNAFEARSDVAAYFAGIPDERIVYIQNEHNMGGSLARNRGISIASGDYITFLDDDDEYLPQKIENQVMFMLDQDCDLSFSNMIMYNTSGEVVDYRDYTDIPSFENNQLLIFHLMKHLTGTPTFMFKAEKLRGIGGFDDAIMGQEFYLMLKSIERGLTIRYLQECNVKVYKHELGAITSGENKIRGENALYEYKKKYFYQLTKKEIRFIRMRHYLVLAVAHKRNKNYMAVLSTAFSAVISAPIECTTQIIQRLGKIKKNIKEINDANV